MTGVTGVENVGAFFLRRAQAGDPFDGAHVQIELAELVFRAELPDMGRRRVWSLLAGIPRLQLPVGVVIRHGTGFVKQRHQKG